MVVELIEEAHTLAQRDVQNFLGPRPGKKSRDSLKALNLTHCCTLLSEREYATAIRSFCNKLGCAWVWLSIEGGKLDILRQTNLAELIGALLGETRDEPAPRIYFHCSAGIHRTGFFEYALLRLLGRGCADVRLELRTLRSVTAEQVGEERLETGRRDRFKVCIRSGQLRLPHQRNS